MKAQPSIQIHDAKPSKKNPNAKFMVKYIGANGEPLAPTESFNDAKAVKTNIAAMRKCVVATVFAEGALVAFRLPANHTVEQKFVKSGFASVKPATKSKK